MRTFIVESLGGGAAALAIVVAVIGLAGALGGALTSYFVAQKTVYINAITTERMKWIGSLRSNIAALLGSIIQVKARGASSELIRTEDYIKTLTEMNKSAKLLELQLNPVGLMDKQILLLLRSLYRTTNEKNLIHIDDINDALIDHSQWLLKNEWERVKLEARGPLSRWAMRAKMRRITTNYKEFSDKDVRLNLAKGLIKPANRQG